MARGHGELSAAPCSGRRAPIAAAAGASQTVKLLPELPSDVWWMLIAALPGRAANRVAYAWQQSPASLRRRRARTPS
eukprot:4813284-Prymnesium_polylepis.1